MDKKEELLNRAIEFIDTSKTYKFIYKDKEDDGEKIIFVFIEFKDENYWYLRFKNGKTKLLHHNIVKSVTESEEQ